MSLKKIYRLSSRIGTYAKEEIITSIRHLIGKIVHAMMILQVLIIHLPGGILMTKWGIFILNLPDATAEENFCLIVRHSCLKRFTKSMERTPKQNKLRVGMSTHASS